MLRRSPFLDFMLHVSGRFLTPICNFLVPMTCVVQANDSKTTKINLNMLRFDSK